MNAIFTELLFSTVKVNCKDSDFLILTSGVKRNIIPLTEPFRVSPLIRKIRRTTYGNVEVTYTALKGDINSSCFSSSNIRYKADSLHSYTIHCWNHTFGTLINYAISIY